MHLVLANGAPPGSLVEVSDSGYITSELYVKPSKDAPVLIVLDGHKPH